MVDVVCASDAHMAGAPPTKVGQAMPPKPRRSISCAVSIAAARFLGVATRATAGLGIPRNVVAQRYGDAMPTPLRIGLVCPYSLTIPGGVQAQVMGLARV